MASPVTFGADLFTLRIKFKRAFDLPVGDILTFSSDPYCVATIRFPTKTYDGDDKFKLHRRTHTVRRSLEPEWNEEWVVANVPATGIELKLKVMDEDAKHHDDKLGVVKKLMIANLEEGKREITQGLGGGDIGVTFFRALSAGCHGKKPKDLGGRIELDIVVEKCVEEVPRDHRPYTVGPNWWSVHSSPLIGIMITKTKSASSKPPPPSRHSSHTSESNQSDGGDEGSGAESPAGGSDRVQHYNFAANKIQLTGPVPEELYIEYFPFRPVIKTFYTKAGLRGRIMNRALKHQYRTLYSYDRNTEYGILDTKDNPTSISRRLLELTHWGQGGRVFTYVITVDGEWRFTETGKEFGIQMLSKHTMHSCVSIHITFAGEFFMRAKKHHGHYVLADEHVSHHNRHGREGHIEDFELVIDNDSGTYRPDQKKLPKLKEFLEKSLAGLDVSVAHCFDDDHQAEKKAHAEEKEKSGRLRFKQASLKSNDSDSEASISSSDEEELTTGYVGRKKRIKRKAIRKLQGSDADERPHSAHEDKLKRGEKENMDTSGRRRRNESF